MSRKTPPPDDDQQPDAQPETEAPPTRGKRKPRSHRVRHPKEAASPEQNAASTPSEAPSPAVNPVAQAAAVLAAEAGEVDVVHVAGLIEDDRERLRGAITEIEAASRDLAYAQRRLKESRREFDEANARLVKLSTELANGTSQPGLPFDASTQERDRAAMLGDDEAAKLTATPALLDRLRRARYILTPEQLDALDHAQRHELAKYVSLCEAAILDGSVLAGVQQPAILASMHVAGESGYRDAESTATSQHCTLCGMMLRWREEEPIEAGMRTGSDCPGLDLDDERTAAVDATNASSCETAADLSTDDEGSAEDEDSAPSTDLQFH